MKYFETFHVALVISDIQVFFPAEQFDTSAFFNNLEALLLDPSFNSHQCSPGTNVLLIRLWITTKTWFSLATQTQALVVAQEKQKIMIQAVVLIPA